MDKDKELIIYNTPDGRTKVSLMAKDGKVWMNQQGIAELFGTSKPNISMHMSNVFKDRELEPDQVVKQYLTTASDGKNYLAADEIDTLNRLVVVFLETAELRVKERKDLTIGFWHSNVDALLSFQGKEILKGKGSVSNQQAEEWAKDVYETFDSRRKQFDALKADQDDIKELEHFLKK